MVDAIVSTVLEQLLSVIQLEIQEVRLVVGLRENINEISYTFKKIQAVLKDAEKKQVKQELVKLWLKDLKDVAYDLDDVLDEWKTKIFIKAQACGVDDARVTSMKVCATNLFSSCFCFNQIGLRGSYDIGHKIKKIKQRLDKISRDKDRYHFIQSTYHDERTEEELQRLQSSSQVEVSEIFGRDSEKEVIISKLLGESSQQEKDPAVSIISIVGMGGLGKTTLAQIVFNDESVKNHFKKRAWVCVSERFDKIKIAKKIIKDFCGKVVDGTDTTWDTFHSQLCESVDGQNFLLVLDDVWSEDHREWDPLRFSFNRGASRSRILVTTRNERVTSMMGATHTYNLATLSDQDCWRLLSDIAFIGRKEECAMLEETGMEIAKKCKGLPLSAKTIGSLLRTKKTKPDWRYVLESDIWDLPEVENFVLPALWLSYNDLSSHLKQCFTYSAIFLKDDEIEKDTIINMWMAQGFLNSSSRGDTGDLEMIGREYFDNLVMRSFFQQLNDDDDDDDDGMYKFKMHDLVHDFAQFIMREECSTLEIKSSTQELNCCNARHLSLRLNSNINSIPSPIYEAKNMRTLQFYVSNSYSIATLSSKLFHKLKCLRALDLSYTKIEELPSEVEKLLHLRFIDLSNTSLKELPETLSNLYNLQTLNLQSCGSLCKLPEGLKKLINLRHLMLGNTNNLSYLPQGIGRLSSLRTLSKFIVGGGSVEGGCRIGELKGLKLLQGRVEIRGLGRIANGNEADEVELKNKQNLDSLLLNFDGNGNDGGDTVEERMEIVLEGLQPHSDLKNLTIEEYPGTKLPIWMLRDGDNSVLSNLLSLNLDGCNNCEVLPRILGKLPNLKTLKLSRVDKVKYIGNEFSGIVGGGDGGVETQFPKLKYLHIVGMNNLEELALGIEEAKDGRKIIFMPCLYSLYLRNCPKLKELKRHISPTLPVEKLQIDNCPELTWTPPSCCLLLPHLEKFTLWENAGELSRSLAPNDHKCLSNLKSLLINYSTYSALPKGLAQLTTLQSLGIYNCGSLMSLPDELQYLSMLQELVILKCPALEPRCQKEGGQDWSKISHIPSIYVGDRWIQKSR